MICAWRNLQRQWRERLPLEIYLMDYDGLLDGGKENGHRSDRHRRGGFSFRWIAA